MNGLGDHTVILRQQISELFLDLCRFISFLQKYRRYLITLPSQKGSRNGQQTKLHNFMILLTKKWRGSSCPPPSPPSFRKPLMRKNLLLNSNCREFSRNIYGRWQGCRLGFVISNLFFLSLTDDNIVDNIIQYNVWREIDVQILISAFGDDFSKKAKKSLINQLRDVTSEILDYV